LNAGAGRTRHRMAEVERLCHQALALPSGQRAAYLASACTDSTIRSEVESLLAGEADAGDLFATTAPLDPVEPAEDWGTAGAYEIQEKLGEGGMGIVFRARQSAPVVREAALKIVHPDLASRQLIARFMVERRALALMDHPNIARVLDAGETSRGLPYLAMELVNGRTIDTRIPHAPALELAEPPAPELSIPLSRRACAFPPERPSSCASARLPPPQHRPS